MKEASFLTKVVHAGVDRRSHHGALSVPIYNASTYAFANAEEAAAIHNELEPGYYYGRIGNPTTEALEKALAELENAEAAVAFASGMAAISAVILTTVKTGESIVAPRSGYSTTQNLLKFLADEFAVETILVDGAEADAYASAAKENTKLFFIESPSNPLLQITDLSAVAEVAKRRGIVTLADNTFATPFNQRPIDLGIDLVVHSGTKYLGGHSDLTAGIVAGDADLVERVRQKGAKLFGGNIAPETAWLVLRGLRTLALRMERHNSNAYALANMLASDRRVRRVYYPGVPMHAGFEAAKRQMDPGFGGMVSFDLGTQAAGRAFVNALKLCALATSLGGVESIVQHSASMTHATLSPEERSAAGISEGLIRFSVGIEDVEDIKADILNALDAIK
ncbi:MAG: cystathionine gamma-lyase [Acidobacteria bacterium OLB17]|nr:MAG: cystathionine gamma-lyase [Acidobacteria bacterium OLB17]MCZ2391107.1 PLP-dependent aspartate aminotransferase family protein [Acidobacteriota bacterium]